MGKQETTMEEQSYGREIESRREFLRIINENDMDEIAESLREESDVLDHTDFSRDSSQLKKKGLAKLLIAEYDKKEEELKN